MLRIYVYIHTHKHEPENGNCSKNKQEEEEGEKIEKACSLLISFRVLCGVVRTYKYGKMAVAKVKKNIIIVGGEEERENSLSNLVYL